MGADTHADRDRYEPVAVETGTSEGSMKGESVKLFGMILTTKKHHQRELRQAEDRALSGLVELLRKKDSIYLEPVTLIGDGQVITDCVFLGGMEVISPS